MRRENKGGRIRRKGNEKKMDEEKIKKKMKDNKEKLKVGVFVAIIPAVMRELLSHRN